MNHGDPKNPKKNPHPVKRYEVMATSDAPGPWDSVTGYLNYEVSNPACTPKNEFIGVHLVPQGVEQHFEMTRVDEKTWKGYFYRDLLQDKNYFGLGVCHWEVAGVSPVFARKNETFASARRLDDFLKEGPQAQFFRRSDYWSPAGKSDGALPYLAIRPEVVRQPGEFFQIKVTVTEVKS